MRENTLLIKREEETSSKFGKNPSKRDLNEILESGFVIIDKHSGPTSHRCIDDIKNIFNISKAGHSGTLDPKVTGVLVIGIGKATKILEYMLESSKEYITLMYLHKEIETQEVKKALKEFTGEITQTPPRVSSVKIRPRKRTIYEIKFLEHKYKDVLFRVKCQHGTYIRKLCTDLGDYLGTGAHMKELRRTKSGSFSEEESISLDKLRNLYNLYKEEPKNEVFEKELRKFLRPVEEMVKDFKRVYIRDTAVNPLCHGSDLAIPGVSKLDKNIEVGDEVAIFTLKEELVCIGKAFLSSKDVMKKNKGAFVKTEKVLMKQETYPSYWRFKE